MSVASVSLASGPRELQRRREFSAWRHSVGRKSEKEGFAEDRAGLHPEAANRVPFKSE